MEESDKLAAFEKKIGFRFKDRRYLLQALTHSSYANERKIRKIPDNEHKLKNDYERLEFLGDAVLELVASHDIFLKNPAMSEGEMSKLRASLVCEPALAYCAREISLGRYLFLGKGEMAMGGAERDSILSDAFEAVIGAIYLDSGFTNAKEFILKYALNDAETKKLFYDSKTILQEIVQAKGQGKVRYEIIEESGPDHSKCSLDGLETMGKGKTKKAAEQQAAYKAILSLRTQEE